MVNDPQEIILDILREIRKDISEIKSDIKELKSSNIKVREGIQGLHGDILRHDRAFASIESDMDRIKNRLDIVD